MAIAEIIEFRGNPDLLVWKAPEENLPCWSSTATQRICSGKDAIH